MDLVGSSVHDLSYISNITYTSITFTKFN